MKGLAKFKDEYFQKYKEKPVKIKPFSKKQKQIAKINIQRIKKAVNNSKTEILMRGSSLFEISGKGEVEIGIYPKNPDWKISIEKLKEEFGEPENAEKNYVRFNDKCCGIEVEIILLKGHEAKVDKKLHSFLLKHPELLKEYEDIKKKYSFSKREYQKQKNKFFSRVIKAIPNN